MLEGICMCFYKAIVQSMFKHVSSENVPLVLILQSYSQLFIVLKHIDCNLVELIWTTKNCDISSVSGLLTKFLVLTIAIHQSVNVKFSNSLCVLRL